MNFVSKFDAKLPADGFGAHSNAHAHVETVSPHPSHIPAGAIIVPDTQLLFNGEFKRSGVDLILSKDDHELVLQDYFKGEKRAALASPDGAQLTGDIVSALTGHVEIAQAGGAVAAAAVIGHVTKLVGSASAVRNGVSIILNNGDNVEKGDVVQSGSDSTLGITFIDGTVFGLSSNARMVLNEMVYDPNGSNNSSLLSLVAGTITFVAGETAKHGDMKVDTPVATMGIRGTAVLVEIDFSIPGALAAPDTKFQVLVEPDGTTGRYILFDKNTLTPIAEVNQAGQQIHIHQGIVSITNEALPPDVQKLITDVFAQKFTDNSNPKSLEHFTDSITPQQQTPIVLPNGTTATPVVLLVKTADSSGVSGITGPTTLQGHIPGPPLVAILDPSGHVAKSFSFGELPGQTGDAQPDHIVVQINWVDINPGDVPTVTVAVDKNAYVYHDAHGNNVTTSLNALQIADIRAVELDFKPNPDPGNNNNGFATWTYSIADSNFDFLAAGETLTLTYNVTVQNNFAGNNETTTQSFTITITGTNDRPVITSAAPAVAFTGDVQAGGFLAPTDPVTGKAAPASGILAFTDPDLTDTHLVTVSLKTPVWSGGAVPPTPLAAFEAALTAQIGTDTTGTGNGVVTWQLAKLPDFLADFLPKGETLTLTYTITVTDSLGATATKDVTVTLTHVDPPDVAWIHPTDGLWSDGANWETGNVPTASDDVVIPDEQVIGGTGKYAVTITSDEVGTKAVAAKSVTLDAANTTGAKLINEGTLTVGADVPADGAGGQLELLITSVLQNSGTIKLTHGGDFKDQSSATNSGTIDVSGGTLNVLVNVDNTGGNLTVDGPATLTVQGATINNAVPPSVITGAVTEGATVTKNGTITNSGTLNLNGDGVLQHGSLGNFGQINVNGTGNALDGVNVTANKALEIFADGALLLDQGTYITNGGAITVDNAATLTLDGPVLDGATIDGGTVTNKGTLFLNGNGVLKNGSLGNFGQINVNGSGNALDGVNVTANNALEIFTHGALLLDQGTHISNGATTVDSGGTLTLDGIDGATIDGGTVTININGTLFLDGNGVLQNGSLGNSGQINVGAGGNALHNESVTANNALEILSGGALLLDLGTRITNSYGTDSVTGGTITVDIGGTLTLDGAADGATVDGGTVTNGGTLALNGNGVLKNGSLGNSGQINVGAGGNALHNETVTGNNALEVYSGGALLLDLGTQFTNTYKNVAGSISFVTGGTVTVDSNAALTLNGATINNVFSDGGTVTINGTLDLNGGGVLQNGSLGNSGQINVNGSGNALDGVNVTANHALEIFSGGALLLDQGTTITNSGKVTVDSGATLTLDGTAIKDGATIDGGTVTNNGTLFLDGSGVLKNGTLVNSAQINVGAGGNALHNEIVSANHALEVLAGATLLLDLGTMVANAGGTVTVDNTGTLKLDGALISGGTINDYSLGTDGTTVLPGAIDVIGASTINGNASLNNGGVTVEAHQTLTLDDVTATATAFTDTATGAALWVDSDNTLKLQGGAAVHGGSLHNAGTVQIETSGATVDGVDVVNTGGTIQVDVSGGTPPPSPVTLTFLETSTVTNGTLSIGNNGQVEIASGATTTWDGVTVDNGDVPNPAGHIQVNGTLDLSGSATISGGTLGISGTLQSTGTNAIDGTAVTVANTGTFDVTAGTMTIDAASTVTTTGTFEVNGGSLIVEGSLIGTATILGASLLELGANSTSAYSSASVAFAAKATGTLQLDHAQAFHGTYTGLTISGLDDNRLDLRDIAFAHATVSYAGTTTGGTLSIFENGVDVSDLHLSGDYTGVHWALSNDGSSQQGTDVTEIPGAITAGLDANGNASEGSAVAAIITDGGQSASGATYDWQIFDTTQGKWIDGSGTGVATANYTPGETDEGHALRVSLTFTDANGHSDTSTVLAGTVNPVADQPVVTASAAPINEDGTSALTLTLTNATDLFEGNDDSITLTVTLDHGATLHGTGVVDNGGGTFTLTAASAADLNGLTITPASEFEGIIAIGVSAVTHDGTAVSVAGTTSTTLTVSPVADQPVVTASAAPINEDGTSALTLALTNAAGLFEGSNDSVTLTVTLDHGAKLHGTGVVDDGGGTFTLTANSATDLNGLTITPASEFEGTVAIGVSAIAHDGSSNSTPGSATASLTVNPVVEAPVLAGQFVNSVADDFSGTTLDPTKWHVYVPQHSSGANDGSVSESGGALHIQDRGILQTVAGFTPTSATPLHTSFTWSFGDAGDYLVVTDRTDGATESTYGGAVNGISFVANWRIGDPGALLITDNASHQSVRVNASLNAGTLYDVSITDDGANQTFVIKDHASGQTVASATSSFASAAAGNLVTITNREGNDGPHQDTIANLSISNAYHGSENGTVALAGLTGLVDTDGTDTLALSLSGFPTGATFSAGALDAQSGHWVISAAQIASLGATPLTMTPPADYNGNFTLHVDATVTDPAPGLATDTKTFSNDLAVTVDAVNDATFSLTGLNQAGNAVEDQQITAVVTDTDTPSSGITYTFQSSSDGTHWNNVQSGTSASYTPTEAVEGSQLRVNVSYTDTHGNAESGTVAAGTVAESPSENATIALTGLTGGNAVQGQQITANVTDPDAPSGSGATFTYSWTVGGQKVLGDTGNSYTPTEADEGKAVSVSVTFTDTHGNAETGATSAGIVQESATNDLIVALNATSAAEGKQITATGVTDGGITVTTGLTYAWQVSTDGKNWTTVSSDNFYAPSEADEGKSLHLVTTCADQPGGNSEQTTTSFGTVGDITPVLVAPYRFAVDEFKVVKGSAVFDDKFIQPPPAGTNFGTTSLVNFTTQGSTWTESGGKAILSSQGSTALTATETDVIARLLTNTEDQSVNLGLKENTAFKVSATFDLVAPPFAGDQYGIDLNDSSPTHPNDEMVQLYVMGTGSGDAIVDLVQANFSTGTYNTIASQTLTASQLANNTQVTLDLNHGTAGSSAITGSFELLNNGTQTSTQTFATTGHVFNNVTYTRADIFSAAPQGVVVTGTAQEGQTLTAHTSTNESDASIHYQWQSSSDGTTNWSNIGTDSAQYVLGEADEGRHIHVVATTSDSDNTSTASVTSTATAAVNDGPVIETDQFSIASYENGTTTISGLKVSESDPAASSETFTVTATTTGPGSAVTPATNSDNLGQTNEDLAEGVVYHPGSTPPATDKVTVTVADSFGATDTVNFIFNLANPPQTTPVVLTGTAGKDVIFGTGYGDILTGGGGQDQFVFKPNSGTNVAQHQITDFVDGLDKIDIRQFTNISAATLPAAEHQQGNDTLITLDSHDTLLLKNTLIANLHNSDFIFHV